MTQLPFTEFAPGVGAGEQCPDDWYPITDIPLAILVGVTGVGKSTTVDALAEHFDFTLLPDRRILTDQMIIAPMQAADGQPPAPVTDRSLRFDYTRRYREKNRGGMAHALAGILVDPEVHPGLLLFDGLRGVNEIEYAIEALPLARFIVLDAPDVVRVQRLLGRNDSFDQVDLGSNGAAFADGQLNAFADLGLDNVDAIFASADEAQLLALVNSGQVGIDDLVAKLHIVIEERRSYDPVATRALIMDLAPFRSVVVDTTEHSPEGAATLISRKLEI